MHCCERINYWGLLGLLISCRSQKDPTLDDSDILDSGSTHIDPSDDADTSGIIDTSTADSGIDTAFDTGTEEVDCSDRYDVNLSWFDEGLEIQEIDATISFAQTHVIAENETRWAPKLNRFRRTGIYVEGLESLEEDQDLRISAWRNDSLIGVLSVLPPSEQPQFLEQSLTDTALEPWYLSQAWYVQVPYAWVDSDISLKVGYDDGTKLYQREIPWPELASDQPFTISRAKMVLFGEADFDTHTIANTQLSQDFFSVLPTSQLRWVDSSPWVLEEIVVNSLNGPVLVASEDERIAQTSDPDRWGILKLIFTHRMSLANIGQGTINTSYSGGNSPFSFGTSIGLGWVRNGDGNYVDLNNAPYSAGWTGWTSIWHGECGNVFNHEVGHSLTMAHFTTGAATSWGIDDEYPLDGTNLATHPWGFDSTRNMVRTWYRVDGNGVALDGNGEIIGKRDSMNGGESANAMTCFPQYTGYHAWKSQNWMNSTATIFNHNGQPSYVQWNPVNQSYDEIMNEAWLPILATDVPVATIVGSLGNSLESFHLYPPMYWASGNFFDLASPVDAGLEALFDAAQYFVRVSFADGSSQDVLINHLQPTTSEMGLFSFNIDLARHPIQMDLFQTADAYPNMDVNNATLLYTRSMEVPQELSSVVLSGQGYQANSKMTIENRCEAGINCHTQQIESFWRLDGQLSFSKDGSEPVFCSEDQSYTSLEMAVQNEHGEMDTMLLFAQRVVKTPNQEWAVAMEDQSPWSQSPDMEQGIRIWAPYEYNSHLSAGNWQLQQPQSIDLLQDGQLMQTISLEIQVEILNTVTVDLSQDSYESPALMSPGSSMYFIMSDPSVGPTNRVWWGDHNPTMLSVPVVDENHQSQTLMVRSFRKTCEQGWGTMWQLNSAQIADDICTYQVYLEIDPADNAHLTSAVTYRSPNTQPIIFEGRLWHGPNANALVDRFVLKLEYTMP